MFSPSTGLALSHDLYRTADAGLHWSKIRTVSWEGQFSFVDEQNGWAVARSEEAIALVRTANGGSSWELLEPEIRP
jgi:photosystem II stability/assembly factor-like uncharacterized protein